MLEEKWKNKVDLIVEINEEVFRRLEYPYWLQLIEGKTWIGLILRKKLFTSWTSSEKDTWNNKKKRSGADMVNDFKREGRKDLKGQGKGGEINLRTKSRTWTTLNNNRCWGSPILSHRCHNMDIGSQILAVSLIFIYDILLGLSLHLITRIYKLKDWRRHYQIF